MTATAPLLPETRPSFYDRWAVRVSADPRLARRWAWLSPTLVTLLAGILRVWNLGHPHAFIFDETYYVKDAWTQWLLGYAATWPEGANESFLAGDTDVFTSTGSFVVHPPLGKFLIGAGMALFGADSSFGWRIATALVGTATVLVLYFVAKAMTGSVAFATVASLLMAIDGLAIVLSRVALLDNFLTFFILLAFWFVLLDRRTHLDRLAALVSARWGEGQVPSWGPVLWNRPWVMAAGAAAGAATAVKWSGLYVIAALGIYLVVTDALARRRAGVRIWPADAAFRQGAATFVLFVPIALVVYLGSWISWLTSDGGYGRQAAVDAPGDRLLVVGAARTAEPLAVPPRDLRLPCRTQLRARLRQPRLAMAAAAAAHLDVLPVDATGSGGVRGRQRLRREHLQHAQPADLVRRRRRGALPGVPVRPHP